MSGRGARGAAFVLGVLALIALGIYSAFGDVHGQGRAHLSLAIALIVTSILLLAWPPMRPPPDQAVPRSAATVTAGRLLISAAWLARCAASGFVGYFISSRLQEHPGFHAGVALFSVAGAVLALLVQCGSAMVGFRPEWPFTRNPLSILRHLLNTAAFAILAGYATLLPGAVETALTWVPSHTYGYWTQRAPAWLGAPLAVVTCVLWFVAVLAVEGVLQWLLAAALGRENTLGAWLADHSPVKFARTAADVSFAFEFWVIACTYYNSDRFTALTVRFLVVPFSYSGDRGMLPGRKPRPERLRAMRAHERPLPDEEERALKDRIAAAAVACAPGPWRTLLLEHRAVLGHQEVQLEVDPPAARRWDPVGEAPQDPQHTVLQLTGFPELAALWRLREAAYRAGEGAPYVQTLTVDEEPATRRADPGARPWRVTFRDGHDLVPPTWQRPPTRRQYREDLRRFPRLRGGRPFWLRERVSRIR
ncbi:hypothetical protein GCM10018793_27520 [Streptomyces sulfonofaciens]|uniref:Uncharacterized protein n=1 Tax=Streptomyces sulfonofaciens TaxID=68272 RepID=A0A919G5J8_9ACTN|nr:hypothetical protein [Streptomyces sulfonofaciens]GHH78079.1 hypothetical protein GCM10018793_27520 [Streptomyces sulfonofaciens]